MSKVIVASLMMSLLVIGSVGMAAAQVSVVLAGLAAVVVLRIETLRMISPRGSRIPREI